MARIIPDVQVFEDLETASRAAARIFVGTGGQAIAQRKRFLVALSGGSTPIRLFQLLASEYRAQVDWDKTHLFWADERCVPAEDPESNYGQARRILLEAVEIPETNVHPIIGSLAPHEAATKYAQVLQQFASQPLRWPRFDLVLLGIGEDGHTASLFPRSPADPDSPTLAVIAHYRGRPADRVTLTPRVFNSSSLVLFMVAGRNKADILAAVLGDRHDRVLYPAQRIDPKGGKVIWLVDEAAAGQLGKELFP